MVNKISFSAKLLLIIHKSLIINRNAQKSDLQWFAMQVTLVLLNCAMLD